MLTAFNPIAPDEAVKLVEQAGLGGALSFLADHGLAGKVKAYAEWMEKLQPNGHREEMRDKRIAPELWRRIIAEDKIDEVATGRVRLVGSSEFGGGPKITIVGIRFDDLSLQATIARHCAGPRVMAIPSDPLSLSPEAATSAESQSKPDVAQADAKPRRAANPSAIPIGAITVTVNQTMDITGLGRTTIDKLMGEGVLVRVKVGGRTLITVASIRRLLGLE